MGRRGGIGRSYADAPEIDGVVSLLPPEKISKTLKVGEFTKARIVGTQGHDLVAVPILRMAKHCSKRKAAADVSSGFQ